MITRKLVHYRLPRDLLDALDRRAAREHVSKTTLVELALVRLLGRRPKPRKGGTK